jgi:hypothetical protein
MSKEYSVKISLPANLYEPLQQIANATGTPLAQIVVQTLKGGMPPSLRKVPPQFHDELLALNKVGDTELWNIIQTKVQDFTDEQSGTAYETADFPMLRRAYAFSLLKWRGHPMPSPHEIMFD